MVTNYCSHVRSAQSVFGLDKSDLSAIQSYSRVIDEVYRSHTRIGDWQGPMKNRAWGNWLKLDVSSKTIKVGLIIDHLPNLAYRQTLTGRAICIKGNAFKGYFLNRLKPQAKEILAEDQPRFGRSTTEQIFNIRIRCEKFFQHQQNLYYVFNDLEKKSLTVYGMQPYRPHWRSTISANLVCTFEQLYGTATSAVQMNGSLGDWFRTTVRVR